MRNFRLEKISFVILLIFILLISYVGSIDAYTNGRKPQRTNAEVKVENFHNEWVQAYIYWDQRHNYRNIFSRSNAPNTMTGKYDTSRPSTFGRIVYNHSNNRYSTPFYTYLNSYRSDIRNNSNIRWSTASHKIGHVFGLKDLKGSINSIMNTDRTRSVLTYPTSIDINRVNLIR